MALYPIDDANYTKELASDELTLLDFGATWCGPCKMLDPIIVEVANDYAGRVRVAKIDIGQNQAVASHFGIMSVPTLLFLRKGKVLAQIGNLVPKAKITAKLDELLARG